MKLIVLFLLISLTFILRAQPPKFEIKAMKGAPKGYLLLAPGDLKVVGKEKTTIMIMKTDGEVVYYQQLNGKHDVKLLPDNRYVISGENNFWLYNGAMKKIDSIGCVNGVKTDSHDLVLLPNGHFLLMGIEFLERDLSTYPWFTKQGFTGSKKSKLECNIIQEIDAHKRLLFEWHSHDRFAFDEVDPFYLNDTVFVGWTHMNSIDQIDENHLLVSLKYFNQLAIINKKTGEVEEKFGGKRSNVKSLFPISFSGQHDARMHGSKITLFDNGHGDSSTSHEASGRVFNYDKRSGTLRETAKYAPINSIKSKRAGNFQELGKGYNLVCYGQPEQDNRTLDIFNATGKPVWSLSFTDTLPTYRSYFTPKIPLGIKQPLVHVIHRKHHIILDVGNRKGAWHWSNGSHEKQYVLHQGEHIQLFVEDGHGGYVGSKLFSL